MNADQELDVRGTKCPIPMLKTKRALSKMNGGDTLRVLATDPHASRDLAQFCAQTGHEMLSEEHAGDEFEFLLRRKQEG